MNKFLKIYIVCLSDQIYFEGTTKLGLTETGSKKVSGTNTLSFAYIFIKLPQLVKCYTNRENNNKYTKVVGINLCGTIHFCFFSQHCLGLIYVKTLSFFKSKFINTGFSMHHYTPLLLNQWFAQFLAKKMFK